MFICPAGTRVDGISREAPHNTTPTPIAVGKHFVFVLWQACEHYLTQRDQF